MTGMCNGKHRNPTGRVPSIALGLVVFVVWWLTEQVKTPTVQDMHATARSSGGNTIRLETTAAASAAAASPLIRHVYVVGCGHSGTSVLKRTVANLPGMMCIPQESQLWISKTGRRRRVALQVAEWDAAAAASGMRGWVEKTPKHIERLKQIWAADPEALVVCVIRDGLDVAASLVERRVPLQDAMQRWVQDNAAVLPHLEDPRLLRVSYEEFASQATVLRVLRQLAQFVGAEPVSDDRLLLALQPPSAALPSGHQCEAYPGEGAKLADLSASYLQLLGVRGQGTRGDPPPNKSTFHNRYRSWQASQAWAPQQEASRWHHRLSCGQQAAAAQHNELLKMLQRLGYSLQALPEQTNGTACQQPPTGGLPAQAAVAGGAGDEPAAGAVPAEGPEHAPTPDSLVLPL